MINSTNKNKTFSSATPLMNPAKSSLAQKAEEIMVQGMLKIFGVNFYWIDAQGVFLGCNDAMLKKIGLANYKACVGKHLAEVCTPEAWSNCQKVMELRETITFEEKQKDSETVYLTIKSPIFDEVANAVLGVVGISIDITERKNTEEKLKKALKKAHNRKLAYKEQLELYVDQKLENENLRGANFAKTYMAQKMLIKLSIQSTGMYLLAQEFLTQETHLDKIKYFKLVLSSAPHVAT